MAVDSLKQNNISSTLDLSLSPRGIWESDQLRHSIKQKTHGVLISKIRVPCNNRHYWKSHLSEIAAAHFTTEVLWLALESN